MNRAYKQMRRAERQAAVRQRIVDAAIELHQTIGPNATSMAEIAQTAKVSRVTVYRHFADMELLARACSGHYFATHPPPDPARWAAIGDPRERLNAGLKEAYGYHRATEAMMSRVLADARDHPVMGPYHALWRTAADVLARPFKLQRSANDELRSTIWLMLSFDAWRLMVRDQGLTDERALALALRLCALAAE